MKQSAYQRTAKLKQYMKVRTLYKQGLTLRDISKLVNKSYQWVWFCVRGRGLKELEKLNLPDLTKLTK